MRGHSLNTILLLVAFYLGCPASHAQTQVPNQRPLEQLVVLKNGEILRGMITQNSEHIIVETRQGSRLVMPRDQTDFICNTLDDAYWGKCARIAASDLGGQKSLFRWCLKHQLVDHAQNQLDLLMQTDIKSSELEFFSRQLGVAVTQKMSDARLPIAGDAARPRNMPTVPSKNVSIAQVPIVLNPSLGDGNIDLSKIDTSAFRPLPSLDSESVIAGKTGNDFTQTSAVRQVSFEEEFTPDTISRTQRMTSSPGTGSPPESPQRDAPVPISIADLEAEMKALPKGTVGGFRRQVEQILIQGCSASKCHDDSATVMPLIKISRLQQNPKRFSQRNLHNALVFADRQTPENSLLLTAATSPHASLEKPILVEGSRQYENLKKWLISISDNPNGDFSNRRFDGTQEPPPSQPDQYAKPLPGKTVPTSLSPTSTIPSSTPESQNPSSIREIPEFDRNQSSFIPRDPFDPEIFNRQSESLRR